MLAMDTRFFPENPLDSLKNRVLGGWHGICKVLLCRASDTYNPPVVYGYWDKTEGEEGMYEAAVEG